MVVLTSFTMPDSPVHLEQRDTKAILDKREIGTGTLFVSERTLSWRNGEVGFTLSYPNISLHAISNDPNLHAQECIYVMIDTHVEVPGVSYEIPIKADDESDDDEEVDISELLLVPEDGSAIKAVYDALKECQALNPDPEDMDDEGEEEEEDEIYEDADEEPIVSNDVGASGDHGSHDDDQIVNDLNINSVNINYDYSNGDHNNDEIFEDAD